MNETAHDLAIFAKAWRLLQASRLLTRDLVIDGTDYRYWQHSCSDLTNEEIMRGLEASKSFHGYFTLSEWRNLCKTKPDEGAPYHRKFLPGPVDDPLPPAEAKKRIEILKATLRE
ncbi:MAG: hypothetical protein CL581_18665 [Alteromonadaceae bacterium]|nr:hypothetical protein [Alteromonadaceae bacterium]